VLIQYLHLLLDSLQLLLLHLQVADRLLGLLSGL
jgi:hypothetical protein